MAKVRLASLVPLPEARELAEALLAKGVSFDDVVDEISALLDALVDWTVVLPAPAGAVAEIVDGPICKALAKLIVRAVERKKR